ncbi:hypothetical protein VmeM32_00158 [Vibrio phage vB_VmeM-32]|nr:hypothetical protein VmeM32_00158 [Vibrio phage vB_VmeM-32]
MRIDKFKPLNGDMSIFENIDCVMKYNTEEYVLFLQNSGDLPYDSLSKDMLSIEEVTQEDVDLIRALYFGVKEHGNT